MTYEINFCYVRTSLDVLKYVRPTSNNAISTYFLEFVAFTDFDVQNFGSLVISPAVTSSGEEIKLS